MIDPGQFTEDAFLGGKLRLRQPKSGHRAGHDAMLLAAATPARAGDRVADLGAGVGAAGLALATRIGGIALVLVEIDPALAALAHDNAAANAVAADVVVLDVTSEPGVFASAGLSPDSVDVVLMNPPFNDSTRHRASPDKARELAHMAKDATLESWIHAGRRILKSGGVLSLIWRADGLSQVLAALERGFGSLEILPVHGDPTAPAEGSHIHDRARGRKEARPQSGRRHERASSRVRERVDTGWHVLPLARSTHLIHA